MPFGPDLLILKNLISKWELSPNTPQQQNLESCLFPQKLRVPASQKKGHHDLWLIFSSVKVRFSALLHTPRRQNDTPRFTLQALAKLDEIEVQLNSTDLPRNSAALAERHAYLSNAVLDTSTPALREGRILLERVGREDPQVQGVSKKVRTDPSGQVLGLFLARFTF